MHVGVAAGLCSDAPFKPCDRCGHAPAAHSHCHAFLDKGTNSQRLGSVSRLDYLPAQRHSRDACYVFGLYSSEGQANHRMLRRADAMSFLRCKHDDPNDYVQRDVGFESKVRLLLDTDDDGNVFS